MHIYFISTLNCKIFLGVGILDGIRRPPIPPYETTFKKFALVPSWATLVSVGWVEPTPGIVGFRCTQPNLHVAGAVSKYETQQRPGSKPCPRGFFLDQTGRHGQRLYSCETSPKGCHCSWEWLSHAQKITDSRLLSFFSDQAGRSCSEAMSHLQSNYRPKPYLLSIVR